MPKHPSNPKSTSSPSSPARASSGSSEGGRRPTGDDPAGTPPVPRRCSARRKVETVLRLLRGASLDTLARETQQSASRISGWRDDFLAGGEESMKARTSDPDHDAGVEEKRRLQAKIGEQTMENDLLYERCRKLEEGLPPARRRSRRSARRSRPPRTSVTASRCAAGPSVSRVRPTTTGGRASRSHSKSARPSGAEARNQSSLTMSSPS